MSWHTTTTPKSVNPDRSPQAASFGTASNCQNVGSATVRSVKRRIKSHQYDTAKSAFDARQSCSHSVTKFAARQKSHYRLHRMHEKRTIVADVRGVCLSVCLSVTRLNSASLCKKTPEKIRILLVVNTPEALVLDGGPDSPPPTANGGDSMQPLPSYFGRLFVNGVTYRSPTRFAELILTSRRNVPVTRDYVFL